MTPAKTFQAETNAEIARGQLVGLREAQRQDAATSVVEKKTAVDRYQRGIEVLWSRMIEEGLTESEALEVTMRAIVHEARGRAREAGSWSSQELHDKANCLEGAADAMLERVGAEMARL